MHPAETKVYSFNGMYEQFAYAWNVLSDRDKHTEDKLSLREWLDLLTAAVALREIREERKRRYGI